jgi:hypothetical protein
MEKQVDHAAEQYKPTETALSESDDAEEKGRSSHKTRDIPIPPISRKKFFGALGKASSRSETRNEK